MSARDLAWSTGLLEPTLDFGTPPAFGMEWWILKELKNFWQGVQEDKIECVREIWEPLTRARFKGG